MTDIDIDAIRQREQAATEGAWSLRDGWGPARDGLARCSRIANKQHDNVLHPEGRDIAGTVADLEFIAAARTDVPALLAKVDELTAERDEYAADNTRVVAQLVAANLHADGLKADLRSANTANTAYAGQVEQLKRAIREALNGVSHVWDAQRIDWVPIAEYAAKKPAEATR